MYICPTIGEDHEKDFLVCGSLDDFKIIVFSNIRSDADPVISRLINHPHTVDIDIDLLDLHGFKLKVNHGAR